MKIRIAEPADLTGVLALQEKYLLTNMPVAARAGGFVTTPFTVSQIEIVMLNQELFVAELDGKIVAYVFAGAWDFWSQWAIFPFMSSRLPHLGYQNHVLTTANTFQYGPICIETSQRGSGLFPQIFDLMRSEMQPKFPIGITFINQINRRSYEAHTKKLGMEVIDKFHFNGNNYYTLAFDTSERVLG